MPRVTKRNVETILNANLDLYTQAVDALTPQPVKIPICDFVERPDYLGHRLYPRQKALLKLIFLEIENMTEYEKDVITEWGTNFNPSGLALGISPDVWKRVNWLKANGYSHFREVVNITGRRGGKGYLGGVITAYLAWNLLKLDSPQDYYNIDPDKDIYIYTVATNVEQATKQQFADIANVIINSQCFHKYLDEGSGERALYLRTPADIRKIAQLEAQGIRLNRRIASVRIQPVSSNASSSRGAAVYSVIFDEMAHMQGGLNGPRTAEEVYNAITPALDQFKKDGFIYVPTSPYTKIGKAYQLYENALETSMDQAVPLYPNMLAIQLTSWDPFKDWDEPEKTGQVFEDAPQRYDEQMKLLQSRDPQTFSVERMSQWSEVINAYLNPKIVDRIFEPFWDGTSMRTLSPVDRGQMRYTYRCHIDPSHTQANFAAAIAHCEKIPDETGEEWYHVIVDWNKVWKPYQFEDHQVDYNEIEKHLLDTFLNFPTLQFITLDQYGSFVTIPRLKKVLREVGHQARVSEEVATAKSNMRCYERFKAAIGMGWVHAFPDEFGENNTCLLSDELKFLQLTNGKVDRQQIGGLTTKDLSDTVVHLVDLLLEDNFRRLEMRQRLGSAELTVGGQGGYHSTITGKDSAREKLGGSRLKATEFYSKGNRNNARPYYGGMANRISRGR